MKTAVHESSRDVEGSGYHTAQKDSLIRLRSLRSLQRELRRCCRSCCHKPLSVQIRNTPNQNRASASGEEVKFDKVASWIDEEAGTPSKRVGGQGSQLLRIA